MIIIAINITILIIMLIPIIKMIMRMITIMTTITADPCRLAGPFRRHLHSFCRQGAQGLEQTSEADWGPY